MQGAKWNNGRLQLNDGQSETLKTCQLVWRKSDAAYGSKGKRVNLPVYLNPDRADVLFSVDLEVGEFDQSEAAQRGLCLVAL